MKNRKGENRRMLKLKNRGTKERARMNKMKQRGEQKK
jgi:hypothetical protein